MTHSAVAPKEYSTLLRKAVSSLPCSITVEKFCHWGDAGSWMLMELASGRVLSALTKTR